MAATAPAGKPPGGRGVVAGTDEATWLPDARAVCDEDKAEEEDEDGDVGACDVVSVDGAVACAVLGAAATAAPDCEGAAAELPGACDPVEAAGDRGLGAGEGAPVVADGGGAGGGQTPLGDGGVDWSLCPS